MSKDAYHYVLKINFSENKIVPELTWHNDASCAHLFTEAGHELDVAIKVSERRIPRNLTIRINALIIQQHCSSSVETKRFLAIQLHR